MQTQAASRILMVRPVSFAFNAQTAVNNAFQKPGTTDTQQQALKEFDNMVEVLHNHLIDVTVINDTEQPHTPDSIFPNNWISFHAPNQMVLYPMFAPNRRLERKPAVLEFARGLGYSSVLDLTNFENVNKFLEGTGSMVLDRTHRIAYACRSGRTHVDVLDRFCGELGYRPCLFHAVDANGQPIYHTNVMMCVGEAFVLICLESIADQVEKKQVIDQITQTKKELIEITWSQMNAFAGNMLQVKNKKGDNKLVMSTQAFQSLTAQQLEKLSSTSEIIHSPLYTIEQNGGGSARCMMAEVC
ncbi:MAG: citrulline utilization hydrolase CtlX [Flammeovirgaceae bacterium]